jgi:lysozyme family protein
MTNILNLEQVNAHRWSIMHVRANRLSAFHATALRLSAPDAKARYQGVSDALATLIAGAENTGKSTNLIEVPWWFIAIVSEREYGGPPHWDRQLGQGDPLNQVSRHVPKGMGPYLSHPNDSTPGEDAWTRCCVDVLTNSAPYAAKWKNWTIGGVLTLFEEYNGLGYAARGIPSAYVWSGSDQYTSGKYIADEVFSASAVDVQEGCAPLLATMMAIDSTIIIDDSLDKALDDFTNNPPKQIMKG